MSTYVSMGGTIQYPTREAFLQVVKELQKRHWLDDEGFWINELGQRLDNVEESVLEGEGTGLDIPYGFWRNLGRFNFFQGEGVKGTVCGTCTDGCFEGWVNVDGVETNYNLEEWAAGNIEEKPPVREEYDAPEGEEGDEQDYWQDSSDWQTEVELAFYEEFGP